MDIKIFDHPTWKPLDYFGISSNNFFYLNYHTLISTWLVLFLLFIFGLIVKNSITKKNRIYYFAYKYVALFEDTVTQALGAYKPMHIVFIASLFTFLLLANCLSILPFTEEPTTDINTTLALGVTAFIYIQIMAIKKHGIKEFIKGYLEPFFLFFPLNIIGSLATIISLSFRLFGNILGGSVISGLWKYFIGGSVVTELIGVFTGANILITSYFGIFDGVLQAFVFSLLSLTYLSMEIQEGESC